MQRSEYGAVTGGSGSSSSPAKLTDKLTDAEYNGWLSRVYVLFGSQVLIVSGMSLFFMLSKGLRNALSGVNSAAFWIPLTLLMLVTMVWLHTVSDTSPANIHAQFGYLLVWGSALAVVSAAAYPGAGVLVTPGILIMAGGFFVLGAFARFNPYRLNRTYTAILIMVVTTVPFQSVCWKNEEYFKGDGMPEPVVTFVTCNLFMVLTEYYMLWKTDQSLEEHGADQVWCTTADLLLAIFGMPCIFPVNTVVLKLGWKCCGDRYLAWKNKDDEDV